MKTWNNPELVKIENVIIESGKSYYSSAEGAVESGDDPQNNPIYVSTGPAS